MYFFVFQAEDGIRDLVRSRGLGDVYKRQMSIGLHCRLVGRPGRAAALKRFIDYVKGHDRVWLCLLYTSDAADERSSVDLGGRRIIKKKTRRGAESAGVII